MFTTEEMIRTGKPVRFQDNRAEVDDEQSIADMSKKCCSGWVIMSKPA
jgi:hypothetical protein